MARSLWNVVPAVRSAERGRFAYFFFLSAALSFAGTLGLVGSEALFLIRIGPSELPQAILMASLSTVLASLSYASVVGRVRNDLLLSALLVAGGVAIWLILGLAQGGAESGWMVLFCGFYVFQAVYVNLHFWTFATDFFDTLASKRLFPLMAVGASAGGMVGGATAAGLSEWFSADTLIQGWAISLVTVGLGLFLSRARLMHWRVLDVAEADESSAEGMRGALNFMARSPVARWLGLSVVGMVVALTVMQYVYLDILSETFGDSRALARFLGLFLAVTNGIEIAVGGFLTPWLVRKLGVARANLIHPFSTLAVFLLLVIDPRLWVAMLARANRELFENSLAGPVRVLFYNALPLRFRGRMRALLEGVFFFSAMSIAGLGLLFQKGQGDTGGVILIGGIAAAVYVGANWRARGEYLRSLVQEVRRGRLDLSEVGDSVEPALLVRLADSWEELLSDPEAPYGTALLELAQTLAAQGHVDRVRSQLGHPRTVIRETCLRALVAARPEDLDTILTQALLDPDPDMRRKCLGFIEKEGFGSAPSIVSALEGRLEDSDLAVRAHAASLLGTKGSRVFEALLNDPKAEVRTLGLRYAPASFERTIRANLDMGDAGLRAVALEALLRLGLEGSLSVEELIKDTRSAEPRLRKVAASALAGRVEPAAVERLAEGLEDDDRGVRMQVQAELIALGEVGFQAARPLCDHAKLATAQAALEVITQASRPKAKEILVELYRSRVREAWESHLSWEACGEGGGDDVVFLKAALRNAETRNRHLAFEVLEAWENKAVVRSLSRVLERSSERMRGNALEVLSNLGTRPVSARFSLLLEGVPRGTALPALQGFVDFPLGLDDVIDRIRDSSDPWLRMAGRGFSGASADDVAPVPDTGTDEEETELMERLLALQQVSIFSRLSLEQLQRIDGLMCEEHFLATEVVVREGSEGEDLYVLMEGSVDFYKGWQTPAERHLGQLQPVGYMGEIALLDDEPRSATAIALQDCRFLTLSGIRFREILLQFPEIAFEVFRVLTSRLRAAESQAESVVEG